jgi:hypothetical protein
MSNELVEKVALAIERADNEKGYDYDHLGIDHPEISDWGIHLAQAALSAIQQDTVAGEVERHRLLAVLGFYRDSMPVEAVKAFQELLVTDADRAALSQEPSHDPQ